jgi:hypothetical protein
MKQVLLLFVLAFVSVQVNAQKACCAKDAKKATTEAQTSVKSVMLEADLIASNDNSIEKRVDEETGDVSFVKKVMDENTGEAIYHPVVYNHKTKAFVNDNPAIYNNNGQTTAKKACCTAAEKDGKACCSSKEKTSVQSSMVEQDGTEKAKACEGKKEGKACCAAKKAATEKTEN